MAFYIRIEKLTDTECNATFRFFDTAYPDEVGELRLNKETDEVEMTKQSRKAFFLRASRKVSVAHKLGELPILIEWAS